MKRALIDTTTGKVHCVVAREFRVTAPFDWVDAPDEADHTWTYTEDQIVAPPATAVGLDAREVRARADRALLDEMIDARAKDADAPQSIKDYIAARGR